MTEDAHAELPWSLEASFGDRTRDTTWRSVISRPEPELEPRLEKSVDSSGKAAQKGTKGRRRAAGGQVENGEGEGEGEGEVESSQSQSQSQSQERDKSRRRSNRLGRTSGMYTGLQYHTGALQWYTDTHHPAVFSSLASSPTCRPTRSLVDCRSLTPQASLLGTLPGPSLIDSPLSLNTTVSLPTQLDPGDLPHAHAHARLPGWTLPLSKLVTLPALLSRGSRKGMTGWRETVSVVVCVMAVETSVLRRRKEERARGAEGTLWVGGWRVTAMPDGGEYGGPNLAPQVARVAGTEGTVNGTGEVGCEVKLWGECARDWGDERVRRGDVVLLESELGGARSAGPGSSSADSAGIASAVESKSCPSSEVPSAKSLFEWTYHNFRVRVIFPSVEPSRVGSSRVEIRSRPLQWNSPADTSTQTSSSSPQHPRNPPKSSYPHRPPPFPDRRSSIVHSRATFPPDRIERSKNPPGTGTRIRTSIRTCSRNRERGRWCPRIEPSDPI